MILRLGIFLLMLAVGFAARAFVAQIDDAGQPLRWRLNPPDPDVHTNVVNPNSRAIRYVLASDAYSATNTAAELNAVRAAFAQWQSVPGTVLKFEDAGVVAPVSDVNTFDNRNVIFWAKSSTLLNGGTLDLSGITGVTVFDYFPDSNTLVEADIVLNGVQFAWFTDFERTNALTEQFVEGVVLHEIGHFIGLLHSPAGGATMFFRGGGGVNTQAGLSSDEITAAQWLHGLPGTLAALGRIQGAVTMSSQPVLGAAVFAENLAGNLVAGTVSQTNGAYALPALPPSAYRVRAAPLDPSSAGAYLARGRDISTDYNTAQTAFLPTSAIEVTVGAGAVQTQNFVLTGGDPAFRITHVIINGPGGSVQSSLPVIVRPGESNLTLGVASANLPTNNATLALVGDGIALGTTTFNPAPGLNFISVPVAVAANATPGLRSLVVQRGADMAYASGFVEIAPAFPDFNFDGLDDRFQRRYFSLFTAPNAAPGADPDADGFNNQAEHISGTTPTNALSLLQIESVTLTTNGSTITWQSGVGKRYQVYSRNDVAGEPWQAVGAPVPGAGDLTEFTDVTATNAFRFYRIEALP